MILDVVARFGADPTGEKDSAGAINAALDYCRNQMEPVDLADPYGTHFFPFQVVIPAGLYRIDSPINATMLTEQGEPYDCRGFSIWGYGARLISGPNFPSGHGMFSLMGSRWLSVHGLTVTGGAGPAMPAVGIMLGQVDPAAANASGLRFRDVFVTGYFSACAVYNLASEGVLWDSVAMMPAGTSGFAYVADGANEWGGFMPQDFVAQRCPVGVPLSFNDNLYLNCGFFPAGPNPPTGNPPINLRHASHHKFVGCYVYSPMATGAAGPYAYVVPGTFPSDLSGLRCEDGRGYSGFPL